MVKKNRDNRRRDNKGVMLRTGESQRSDGRYEFKWTDKFGKRKTLYAVSIKELRDKEKTVPANELDGSKTMENCTINDLYKLWCDIKRGIKDNTFQNYKYMYRTYVEPEFGRNKVKSLKKSDVKVFYNRLVDSDLLRVNTMDTIQNVLHQILDIAVDDRYIMVNPMDNALTEIKRAHSKEKRKKKALSLKEQTRILDFIKDHPTYSRWYPLLSFLLSTGLRIGEATGLRWCDVDMENNEIDINHTLVYYDHGNNHCAYEINSTKTEASTRVIPMLTMARQALLKERENQMASGTRCKASIGGYTDFIFLNRFGYTMNNASINKVIRRIVRDYNDAQFLMADDPDCKSEMIIVPMFSCHILRHTFATRMIEAGVNVKVVQEILGHTDVTTTLNIYVDATQDLKKKEIKNMDKYLEAAM